MIDSFFIINAANGYIAQFDVFENTALNWNELFCGIHSVAERIKINNVDSRSAEKIAMLNTLGIKNTIDQYEMELNLLNN